MANDTKKKVRLLMISTDAALGRVGSAVRERMEHYGSLVDGIDIIFLGSAGSPSPFELSDKVTVYPVISRSKGISALKAVALGRRLATPDTVITTQDPFELGLIGAAISALSGKPLHVQVHIDFFSPYFKGESWRQRIQAALAPSVLRRASSVRAVSQKIADHISKSIGIDPAVIVVAPIFVDAAKAVEAPVTIDLHAHFPQFDWIVLVASRLVRQKNIPLAIEAFNIFQKSYEKSGMIIVGSGSEKPIIERLIRSSGLDQSIIMGSWNDQFISCMKTSDVFILSSDYEGWGMTVVEAAAVSKPVLMTNVGCAGEFIYHEKNGIVAPTRDAAALAAGLTRYRRDRDFASAMGAQASADALAYMSRETNDALQRRAWDRAANRI